MRRAAWSRPAIRGASLRRAIAVALAALMLAALFSAPTASHAQSGCNPLGYDWCVEYDFAVSDHGFVPSPAFLNPVWVAGQGWQAMPSSSNPVRRQIQIYKSLPLTVFLGTIEIEFYAVRGHFDTNPNGGDGYFVNTMPAFYNLGTHSGDGTRTTTVNTNASAIGLQLQVGLRYGSDPGGTGIIKKVRLRGNGTSPLPTPTPSPTPIGGQPPLGVPCRLLGADANFTGFPGRWQIVQGDPIKTWQGLLLTAGSQIRLRLPLAESRRYRITGVYTVGFRELLTGGEKFYVGLGGVTMEFPLENVTTPQIISVPPVQYPPTDDGYYLTLTAPEGTEFGLVIRDICVSEVPSEDQPVTSGSAETCSACDPPQSLFDIFGIIGWLLCGIRNFFECLFIPFLRGLLQGLLNLVATALSFIQWIVETAFNGVLWIVQILVAPFIWIIAHIRNFFTNVANDLQVGTLASLGNIGVSYARDLPTMLGNGLASLGNELSNILQNARSVFDLIGGLFNLFVRGLAYLITLTPLIIETLISGFNASATAISRSPICTNSSDFLYAVCLGFYVIDNTILSGPAFYLIPLVIGLLVFDTFVWAFQAIRKAFS